MSLTNKLPDPDTLKQIARLKQVRETLVEKDWYVTQVIRVMAGIRHDGFPLIFTGGTALSKAHHLIQRFSEDVDFRVNASRDQHTRGERSQFKNAVVETLRKAGFPIEANQIRARDDNRFFGIEINYGSSFEHVPPLRPHIQIEVFFEELQLAPVPLPVASFVNELTKQPPEVEGVNCIALVESAADKLSAITWRIPDRRREADYDDPTIVRHIHDLAMLQDTALAHPSFANLTAAAVQRDIERPKNLTNYASLSLQEKFDGMLSILDQDGQYPDEYSQFVDAMCYVRDVAPPDFKTAVEAVKELVKSSLAG